MELILKEKLSLRGEEVDEQLREMVYEQLLLLSSFFCEKSKKKYS